MKPPSSTAPQYFPASEVSPARILIVDDESRHTTALCNTLRDQGYDPLGFTSGTAALAALREGLTFDLLLTDLMMPEMDGIALLQAARQIDGQLVGIVMTGEGTIATAVEAMKAGALDYILKPFKLATILPVLSRALSVRELRRENARLAESVRERSAELEAANKELEAFTYSVSHDLRAPLRYIDGFAGLLLKDHLNQLDAAGQRHLQHVKDGVRKMNQLIHDLLEFSRLSRQPIKKQTVDLGALVREILGELQQEQQGREIELSMGPFPACEGDLSLLKQVFVNLLSNALKFTRKRPRAVIEVRCEEKDGELTCMVRDNGAGFDMQSAAQLFGVFQRMHRQSEFEGTGIELSIVQRIIVRHGGRIWAEAETDRGAAFYFTLPV